MAGTDDQREGAARRKPVSARLTLGPEDAWRTWRDLPDDDRAPGPEETGTGTGDIPEFSGSMMVVAIPEPGADDVVLPNGAPPAEEPAAPDEPAHAGLPPVIQVPPGEELHTETTGPVTGPAPADRSAPPGGPSGPRERSAARRATGPRPSPSTRRLPIFDAGRTADPPPARPKPTPRRATGEPVYVLDSGLDDGNAAPPEPLPDRPVRSPSGPSARRAETGAPGSISRLVAEAVAMLETRVARQQAETEELLAGIERRHASQLARLDSRLAQSEDDPHQLPEGFEDRVYASFMEVVERLEHVEERAFRAGAAEPAATPDPGDEQARAAAGAATAFLAGQHEQLSERHDELAAEHDELARRHGELEARYDALLAEQRERGNDVEALVAQQIQLADGQRRLAEAHRLNHEQSAAQLSDVLARIETINEGIERRLAALPGVEKRVSAMEANLEEGIAGLRLQVDDLTTRFPLVAEAAERAVRAGESITELHRVAGDLRARLDSEIGEVRAHLDELDAVREQTRLLADQGTRLRADLELHQAEQDRRYTRHESRIAELEDLVGGEAGVDRQLILDRIEEIERGLAELDPQQICRQDDLDALRAEIDIRRER